MLHMTVVIRMGNLECLALKNRHKSKTDYLILNRKKWDFQIQIILIQIKCFKQLAPDATLESLLLKMHTFEHHICVAIG